MVHNGVAELMCSAASTKGPKTSHIKALIESISTKFDSRWPSKSVHLLSGLIQFKYNLIIL